MASMNELKSMISRALEDISFRKLLLEDPGKAAEGMGYSLTDEQMIACMGTDLPQCGEVLEKRFSKVKFYQ